MNSEKLQEIENRINNLAIEIYNLHEPLDWKVVRPNLFPSTRDINKGFSRKKITDLISDKSQWYVLYIKIFNEFYSNWLREFQCFSFGNEKVIIKKYGEEIVKALINTLIIYNPRDGKKYMNMLTFYLRKYIQNSLNDEKDREISLDEFRNSEDSTTTLYDCIKDKNINIHDECESKDQLKLKFDKLLDNINKIYKQKNCSSGIDNKSISCTLVLIEKYNFFTWSKSEIEEIVEKYEFLKPTKDAIFYFYGKKDLPKRKMLQEFCQYLGASYTTVMKQKNRDFPKEKKDITDDS